MTGFSASPKLIKGGLVLVDAETARVLRIISLQYNADTLTRKLQTQEAGGESGNRGEPTRFKGPAIETLSFEAEIDATDQLEFPDQHPSAGEFGIQPQLALLESLVHPAAAQLQSIDTQASSGTLEIAPMLAPLPLFVWSKSRIVPVKVSDFSITEEAFDPALNPLRAKLPLSLRVPYEGSWFFGKPGLQEVMIEGIRCANSNSLHHQERDAIGERVVFVLVLQKVIPTITKQAFIYVNHLNGGAAKEGIPNFGGLGVVAAAVEERDHFIEDVGSRDQTRQGSANSLPVPHGRCMVLIVGELQRKQIAGIDKRRSHGHVR